MATVPSVTTSVSDTATAQASGTDLVCIIAPVSSSADYVPRMFGTASAAYAQHGYCEGVEYAARHAAQTGKPFLFVGVPIATAGVIGRKNAAGNTGLSVVDVAAGGAGTLTEHDGIVKVVRGGVIGTDQILLSMSLDGGVNYVSVRLGSGNAYTIPYVGASLSFAAGTLVTGDTVLTWHASGPRSDATGWAAARAALAAKPVSFRSAILIGDLLTRTEANALLAQVNAYETTNKRFVYCRASVYDRLPQAALAKVTNRMTGAPTLTFANVGSTDTCTRSAGSWISDGFQVGDVVTFAGTASNNLTTGAIASLSATVLTFGATTSLTNEGPVSNATAVASPALTFAEVGASGDTLVRNRGSWLDDGFRVGDKPTIAGTASNNFTAAQGLTAVTATTLTFGTDDLTPEVIGTGPVTITAGQTKAAWMTALDTEFEPVNGFRLDLAAGRGRYTSPFSGWDFRRPASWFASTREYQHDLHVATWRKADGPVDADLFDTSGTLVEWDDRDDVDGGAGSAARFTTLRTWNNGPTGAYVTQSLTRGVDGSLLSQTHNVAVVNLACTVTQIATENVIGRSLILNDDGTATRDSLSTLESEVDSALSLALMQNRGEGKRASKAVWTASTTDILNIPDAVLTGTLDLNLNGTIHSVRTTVRVRTAGQ